MNKNDLELSSYYYDLPDELVANRPASNRDHSKLMHYYNDGATHKMFYDLPELLPEGALLVLNETKVFPCRLTGKKSTGAKAEIFILDLNPFEGAFKCLIKSSSKKHLDDEYFIDGHQNTLTLKKINGDGTFMISFENIHQPHQLESLLKNIGGVPIPPYIRKGVSDQKDLIDYQTVFAKNTGSVAAPTAGLHFTPEVFSKLKEKNIEISKVTLHVGLGTFAPVKADTITDHKMHREEYFITKDNLLKIKNAYENKRPVVAVGTTTLRVLESSYSDIMDNLFLPDKIVDTDIFIYPGKEVKSINGLITNFHLPGSSLLMLVSALVGRKEMLDIYQQAIEEKYRFFSYGDAMYLDLR